jgi:hypothetical protein
MDDFKNQRDALEAAFLREDTAAETKANILLYAIAQSLIDLNQRLVQTQK